MLNQLKRRKKLLVAGAAAAAAAGLVYYYWPQEDDSNQAGDQGPGRPTGEPAEQQQEGPASIDASMNCHFQFIQDVSTPHELELLLPRVKAALYEMTDVQAEVAALPPNTPVKAKLEVMAQHSIGRALAATWLLPALDLLVRAKLNIVGRHLFLQERFCDLPAAQTHFEQAGPNGYSPRGPVTRGPLPPRIPALAINAFLPCDYFAEEGCRLLVEQVLSVVAGRLSALDMGAARGPEDLILLVQALNAQVANALPAAKERPGQGTDWALLLLGQSEVLVPDDDSAMDMLLSESMLHELQAELQAAVSSPQFQQAMTTAVQHCTRLLTDHIVELFPASDAAPTPQGPAQAAAHSPIRQVSTQQAAHSPTPHAAAQPASDSAPVPQPPAQPAAHSQSNAQVDARQVARSSWGSYSTDAGHESSPIKNAPAKGSSMPSLPTALGINKQEQTPTDAPSAAIGMSQQEQAPPVAPQDAIGTSKQEQVPQRTWWGYLKSFLPAAAQQLSAGVPVATLQEITRARYANKPPRPMARLLRPVHLASDPLFADVTKVSQGVAALGPVMELSASIFARPIA